MNDPKTRIRIENEMLGRLEKRYSEEEQANHLMSLLMDHYPLLSATVLSLDPDGKTVSVFAHRGLSNHFIKDLYARKSLPVVAAAASGEVRVSGDDPRADDPSFRLEHAYRSLYAAPCRMQEETLGVFIADSSKSDLLAAGVREDFESFVRLTTFFLALRNLKGKVSRVPDVDPVTGFSTFKSFHEVLHQELTRARKFGHPVSLLFLKIRHLREMNEVYGHVSADETIVQVAKKIRANLRDVDFVSRASGTIYVVMPRTEKGDAAAAARNIAAAMDASPVAKGGVQLQVAIGAAAYPKDGDSERVLLPLVESMVHESVRKGGNAVSVYRD